MDQQDKEKLKQQLTKLQYQVTQEGHTEDAFKNEYWNVKDKGVYDCIVCGKELFTSEQKYDSGCGWPSFYTHKEEAVEKEKDKDYAYLMEVHCTNCKSHLGHIFDDGPKDKTGKRFCINSASLRFKGN